MASAARVALYVVGLAAAAASGIAACLADLPETPPKAMSLPAALPVCGDGVLQRDAGEQCDPGDSGALGCQADCQVDCESGFKRPNQHCYFRLTSEGPSADGSVDPSADAAASTCAGMGAHLVSFNGPAEHAEVEMGPGAGGAYWVALRVQASPTATTMPIYEPFGVNEPGWRADCPGCYAASALRPATYFGDYCSALRLAVGPCVGDSPTTLVTDGGTFFGAPCNGRCADGGSTELAGVVCEREPPGLSGVPCEDGGVCITLPGTLVSAKLPAEDAGAAASYYQLFLTQLARDQAAATCAATTGPRGAPGHLVVFNSADEREELSRELAGRTTASMPELDYWVGIAFQAAAGGFVWEDGTPASGYASEWAEGEPTADDTAAYSPVVRDTPTAPFDRQLLRSTTPDDRRPFVCEYE